MMVKAICRPCRSSRRGIAAALHAQGRGARPVASSGKIEQITVHGKALEGNLEADSPDREVSVYLPPSYAGSPTRRYPVVYLLHGYGGRDDIHEPLPMRESGDRLAPARASAK
jgi:predicted dienelactone hydrolase